MKLFFKKTKTVEVFTSTGAYFFVIFSSITNLYFWIFTTKVVLGYIQSIFIIFNFMKKFKNKKDLNLYNIDRNEGNYWL